MIPVEPILSSQRLEGHGKLALQIVGRIVGTVESNQLERPRIREHFRIRCIRIAAQRHAARMSRCFAAVALIATAVVAVVPMAASTAAAASSAILPGFNSTTYGGNDDGSYPCTGTGAGTPSGCTPTTVALPFTPNFFGTTYSGTFLNNNGNLTFGQPLATYTPYPLSSAGPPIIAPFFADVDTRTGNTVTFGNGTVDGHNAFGVNWPGVGCYSENTSVLDNFQVVLIDRSDIAPGDFDIEFNYGSIQWDSGQASGGNSNCQGGTAARAGYAGGSGATGTYYEIPGSGIDGAFLDSNTATGLIYGHYNSSQAGRYVYQFRNGQPLTVSGAPAYAVGLGSGKAAVHNTTCSQGSPVNCASGDFWHTFTDLSVPGRGPALDLNRTYNSQSSGAEGIFGYGWSSSYGMHLSQNPDGTVTVTEEDGSQVIAVPSGGGVYAMPAWADSTLVQNADGTWTFTRRATHIFNFSLQGQLTAEKDLNGYTSSLAYNSSGQLKTVADSSGRTLVFVYGTNGLVSSVSDAANQVTQYGYDASGNLTSVTDPMNRVTSFTYDTNHLLLTMTDPRGGTVTNVYDASNRVTQQTDPMGRVTSFSYSSNNFSATGGTTTITGPNNIVTTEQYTSGELMALTRAPGTSVSATTLYTYDPNTLGRTAVTDPNGHTTTYSYDASGNLLSATDPLGRTTTWTYNAFNEPLSATDPAGVVTTFTYDANGNLLTGTVTGVGGSPVETSIFTYGDSSHPGDITQVSDPAGHVTNYAYDGNGDVITLTTHPTSGVNDTTLATYDAIGRVVCTASPNAVAAGVTCPAAGQSRVANTTTYAYDADSEVASVTDPLGNVTQSAYDGNGNVTSVTDQLGNITKTVFDADNRVTSVTQGFDTSAASTISDGYDLAPGAGACSSSVSGAIYCSTRTDPNGLVTVDYYNAANELVAETQPASGTSSLSYDSVGNLVTRTTTSGLATYGYDAANELTSITYSNPATGSLSAPNVTYAYNADGRRTQMTDGTGTASYAYVSLERLSTTTNGAGSAVSYGYDLDNNVTSLTYPGGHVLTQAYDGAGRESRVTDWLANATTFAYDADGNLTTTTYPNTTTATYVYNANDQLTSIAGAPTANLSNPFATFATPRNADGQVTSETSTGRRVERWRA